MSEKIGNYKAFAIIILNKFIVSKTILSIWILCTLRYFLETSYYLIKYILNNTCNCIDDQNGLL